MNSECLTLKQMFDVTAQLVNDREEIHGLDKIQWEKNSWKHLSLHFHRKFQQLFFFYSGGVNFLMQLQFLAPVELFF